MNGSGVRRDSRLMADAVTGSVFHLRGPLLRPVQRAKFRQAVDQEYRAFFTQVIPVLQHWNFVLVVGVFKTRIALTGGLKERNVGDMPYVLSQVPHLGIQDRRIGS